MSRVGCSAPRLVGSFSCIYPCQISYPFYTFFKCLQTRTILHCSRRSTRSRRTNFSCFYTIMHVTLPPTFLYISSHDKCWQEGARLSQKKPQPVKRMSLLFYNNTLTKQISQPSSTNQVKERDDILRGYSGSLHTPVLDTLHEKFQFGRGVFLIITEPKSLSHP